MPNTSQVDLNRKQNGVAIQVFGKSSINAVAETIIDMILRDRTVEIRAMDTHGIIQAIRGIATASTYLKQRGINIGFHTKYVETDQRGHPLGIFTIEIVSKIN